MTLPKNSHILALNIEFVPAFLTGGDAGAFDRHGGVVSQSPQGPAVSVISMVGALRNRSYFGGDMTALREQISQAANDPAVKSIILDIDSPGGTVAGTPETAATVREAASKKPVIAAVNTFAASAAYWIGSNASKMFIAPSGKVGSIGVIAAHTDFSAMDEMMGVATTLIHAGKFKAEGNPFEPLTDEARAQIQDEVDEAYEMFVADVAKGRGVTRAVVNREFGQGRMVGAADAVKRGMADGIAPLEQIIASQVKGKGRRSLRLAGVW